ncbi:2-oxo acid dehydrogenase subunit E2 [Actinokineospora auranticolor]|uniref:2-oxoacid dehydrogenase/acyltransferase catalytic subunit n=1 Tax=Actinokineospora auranticolor TaxID=155976 RepID=A0A2S6H1W7_9PSEU|nr:2-oxo acid dehydrogenase subunit E2 [Actinokineospora auranticolor]PPK71406.1 2-oxoacid dehydrogenase/acyltransferase catalytic subunit [Actinokineospora auranticolor]
MTAPRPIPAQRRHTLLFLDQIRDFSPVHLDTEVDATAIVAARAGAEADGRRLSVVTLIVKAAGEVLAKHPGANSAIHGTEIITFDSVSAKVTLDKRFDGARVVLATVLPADADLADIQAGLDDAIAADPDTDPRFAGIRALRELPAEAARNAFRESAADLTRRAQLTGTFAVTSLGHRDVDGFHSVGGTTVTFGVGRIVDRAVVRAGEIVVAPVLRLSLTFDHRVIDGAEAADVLTETKTALEGLA